jgi:hypothetical protein
VRGNAQPCDWVKLKPQLPHGGLRLSHDDEQRCPAPITPSTLRGQGDGAYSTINAAGSNYMQNARAEEHDELGDRLRH